MKIISASWILGISIALCGCSAHKIIPHQGKPLWESYQHTQPIRQKLTTDHVSTHFKLAENPVIPLVVLSHTVAVGHGEQLLIPTYHTAFALYRYSGVVSYPLTTTKE
jgi:hypothetical protein